MLLTDPTVGLKVDGRLVKLGAKNNNDTPGKFAKIVSSLGVSGSKFGTLRSWMGNAMELRQKSTWPTQRSGIDALQARHTFTLMVNLTCSP